MWVLIFWIAALVGATLASQAVGTAYSSNFQLPHTESTEALALLQANAPAASGDSEQIVIQTSDGKKISDPEVKTAVDDMLTRMAALPHVTRIVSPYSEEGAAQVSKDGTIAFATVTLDRLGNTFTVAQDQHFVATAKSAAGDGIRVEVSGQIAEQANKQSIGGTLPGVVLALIVLLLVFGSIFAAALPIVSALLSLGTAVGLIGLLSHVLKMPVFSIELVLLIGLGVGVDYALFIVTRHRQGLLAGMSTEESIVNAVNTSGRAVMFAGIIVCIALLGMFALGVTFFYGLAVAASIGVLFTMIAALTALPAFLSFIGPRVMSRKQRRSLATDGPRVVGSGTKGFWPRWADFIKERPVVPALVALVIVVLVALPFFSLRLGLSDAGNDPTSTTTRQAYDLLAEGFGPGFNGPLQLVTVHDGTSDAVALDHLASQVRAQPGVAEVSPVVNLPPHDGKQVSLILAYPDSSPESAATSNLIAHLRSDTIPEAVSGTGTTVYVGGNTAIFVDFAAVLASKLPLFIGLVVLLSFLLLAAVFRSLVIPLTAACMNLLSIGAAFGVMVAVFEWGWGGSIIGSTRPGPVDAFLPVMLFAILFGLSMDYEVFLVSRIHEEFLKSGDNRTAVRNGLAATGKTITAAALIMILVFGAFIFGGIRVIKEFGIGLAAGIFIDAFIIRMAVVPALMFLFGRANWWFPKWLDRIVPHLAVEHPDDPTALNDGDTPEGPDEPSDSSVDPDPEPVPA